MTPRDLRDVAIAAVRAGGGHALANRSRRHEVLSRSAKDIKLVLDRECQTVIEQALEARHPGARILGEEGEVEGRDGPVWIVDPIDGTANFFRNLPWWCCSVAVRVGNDVVAGAVYAPELDRLYAAAEGEPATVNGQPIRASGVTELAEAFVATGISKTSADAAVSLAVANRLQPRVMKLRIMGAAALDLCMVAEGAVDGFYETGLYEWDVAAAAFIVERAGGEVRILNRQPDGRLTCLGGNPALVAQVAAEAGYS